MFDREPVAVVGAIVAAIPAVIGVLTAFHVVAVSAGQLAAVAALVTTVGAAFARSQVTPVPKL